jgi:hypothetical protein
MDFATAPPSRSTAEQSPVDETTGRVEAMDWADEHDNIDYIDYIFGLAGNAALDALVAETPIICASITPRAAGRSCAPIGPCAASPRLMFTAMATPCRGDSRLKTSYSSDYPDSGEGRYLVPDATNASWLIQKKNKRGKCKAAEQEGPVPGIETKKTSIRRI